MKWGVVGAAVLVAVGIFGSGDNTNAPTTEDIGPAEETIAAAPEQVADVPGGQPAEDSVSANNEDSAPAEFQRAARKAETYATMMDMSKQRILEQLTSEYDQYSPEAAQYAIDNLDVDFNEVALKKAESYSKTAHMSQQGIYEQLVSFAEGFTETEAQYAIDNLEADYNQNALEKAKSYQRMDMSTGAIYDQLVSFAEGFTPEQAQYAMDNLPQ